MDELDLDRDALLRTFHAEAEEILAGMERSFVALEARPGDEELLRALFRHAHTLKSAAGLVALGDVHDLAHDLEDVLDRLRKRTLAVDDALVTLLLGSVDVLRAAVAAGAEPGPDAREAAVAFRARLVEAAASGAGRGELPAREELPPARATGEASPQEPPLHHPAGQGRTLRVDVSKLDRMLDVFGEIAVARGRLGELLARAGAGALEAHREADRLHDELQELIMQARMVPIGPLFQQHVRTVRDVATVHGKQVRLVVEGEDAEVDTAVVEGIRDALTHVVRNALDHGIEPPDARRARGKDPAGTLVLRAFREAGMMVIQVVDDGAGLDRRRIAEKAAALGLAPEPSRMTEEEVARVVFEPGLSTAARVTDISGRGVGMDVVRRDVEALRGSVSLESAEGEGTTVTFRVPLTLAIIQGFFVGVAGEVYVVPLDDVVECRELRADEAEPDAPVGVLDARGKPLPFVRLRDWFGAGGPRSPREHVVVVRHGTRTAAIAVDELHGEGSTVIKPLGPALRDVQGIAGSSILGDGRIALILDVAAVLRDVLRRTARRTAAA